MPNHAPAPTSLAQAVRASLPGAASSTGFTLLETLLVVGGVALLSAGGFVVYQGAALSADVKTEQSNIQRIAQQSDRVYGSLGSYENLTTQAAITAKVPPQSMITGSTGLMSRWQKPVLLEPTDVGTKTNAGLQITYQDVPAKACARLAQAASGGMFDVKVAGESVFDGGKLDVSSAVAKCAAHDTAPMIFTYYGGTSGLAGQVLAPIEIPALPPTSAPVVTTVPPVPPPVAPPTAPPTPGCGPVPAAPASGITPAGQTCSFFWQAVAAPSCWTSQPLCAPTVAPPPVVTPPAVTPPSIPPSTPPPGFCAVPPTSTRACATPNCADGSPSVDSDTESQTFSCPAGQIISTPGPYQYASSAPQTRARTRTANESASCPDPFDAPRWTNNGTFGAWTPTSAWTPALACAPATPCVAPAGNLESATQTVSCPAGQISNGGYGTSTFTQSRFRMVSYSCPSPTGPYVATPGAWMPWSPSIAGCAPPAPPVAPCVAPPTSSETGSQTASCPAGQVTSSGASTFTQTRSRWVYYACPTSTGPVDTLPDAWSAYSPLASAVCAPTPPACTAPATTTAAITRAATPETQPLTCPAGQTGTLAQSRSRTESGTRTTSWTCPGPTSAASDSWSGSYTYGGWATTTNTCTPTASPCTLPTPSAETNTETRVATQNPACPSGQSGAITQTRNEQRTQNRSASCPAPTGAYAWSAYSAWSAWAATSSWTTTSNTCTPICGPAPAPASQSLACPAGQTGAITQTHGWTAAAAPTCWTASPWGTTGNTCTPSPPACVSAPGTPAMNTPGGPQMKWLIACTANWGWESAGSPMPNFAAIKAATPVGGTRTAGYGATPTSGGWQCVSTNGQWLSPTISGSSNTGLGTQSYVYAEVEWNSVMYTGWTGEQTLNFDQCDLKGGTRVGDCYLGGAGAMPPGLALVNAVNKPSTVHAGFYNYACP